MNIKTISILLLCSLLVTGCSFKAAVDTQPAVSKEVYEGGLYE